MPHSSMKIAIWLALSLLTVSAIAQRPLIASKLSLVGQFDDGEEASLEATIKLVSPEDVVTILNKRQLFGGYNGTEKIPFLDKVTLKFSTGAIDVPKQALEVLSNPELTSMELSKDGTLYHIVFRGSDGEKGYTAALTYESKIGRWQAMEIHSYGKTKLVPFKN